MLTPLCAPTPHLQHGDDDGGEGDLRAGGSEDELGDEDEDNDELTPEQQARREEQLALAARYRAWAARLLPEATKNTTKSVA